MGNLRLQDVQVDCTNLDVELINYMCEHVKVWNHNIALHRDKENVFFSKFKSDDEWYIRSYDEKKVTVTPKRFIKLANGSN